MPLYILNARYLITRWNNNKQVLYEPSMRLLLSVALGLDTKSCSWCGEGHVSSRGACQTGLGP
jgi:hypothetical protein